VDDFFPARAFGFDVTSSDVPPVAGVMSLGRLVFTVFPPSHQIIAYPGRQSRLWRLWRCAAGSGPVLLSQADLLPQTLGVVMVSAALMGNHFLERE
jgi:hypothetical protein